MTPPDSAPSRREFLTLSAATAGALLAGQNGHAVPAERVTDRYAFLVERVESDFPIPTLVRFEDESGFGTLDGLDVEYRTHAGETVAAHTGLTPAQAESVAAGDATVALEYAPGANPFWTLADYEDGVVPDPADSADFVAFEEALAGLEHLADEHPDRVRVDSIGTGHGHENVFEGRPDPREVPVVELTDGLSDEDAFESREKLVFVTGIHGDERVGVEGGLRFVEEVLTGERPGVADLLSEFVLVFVVPNPDGWVVRERTYEDPVDPPDFRRYNGADRDLNRQQPVAGWIQPDHLPADPDGANLADDAPGVDGDVPEQVATELPESLAMVEWLRSYDNVGYVLDIHGMYGHTNAVLAIEASGGTPLDRADSFLLRRAVETRLHDTVGSVDDWRGAFERAADETESQVGCDPDLLCRLPTELFGDGTGLDTIDYTVSGALDAWAALPESDGGLGATALTFEVVFSNSVAEDMEVPFVPDVLEFQVAACGAICRATVEHAAADTGVAVETGGRSTAYVASESLVRRSSDLPHVGDADTSGSDIEATGGVGGGPAGRDTRLAGGRSAGSSRLSLSRLAVDRQRLAGGDTLATAVAVPEGTHTLTVALRSGSDRVGEMRLRDADGTVVDRVGGPARNAGIRRESLTAVDPEPGEWRLEASVRDDGADIGVRTTRLLAEDVPDPMSALGYGQREYRVTPLAALEALDSYADAPVDRLTVDDIRAGALFADGSPTYDNLVVPHSHEFDSAARVTLAAFVEAGGNLVLTDSGLELASGLDVAGLSSVGSEDVTRQELDAAEYPNLGGTEGGDTRNDEGDGSDGGDGDGSDGNDGDGDEDDEDGDEGDASDGADGDESDGEGDDEESGEAPETGRPHPLVIDRPRSDPESWIDRREPWRHPPLGYARGEVPMYAVEAAALGPEVAVASASDERVRLATAPTRSERVGVHLLGSLLPPAAQHNLHPFGLADHALSTLGYLLLCNALGYRLSLSRDGDWVTTLGSTVESTIDDDTTGGDDDDADGGVGAGNPDGDDGETADGTTGGNGSAGGGADGDGPGFGAPAGVAGLAGAGYLLARRLDTSPGADGPGSPESGEGDGSGSRGTDTPDDADE